MRIRLIALLTAAAVLAVPVAAFATDAAPTRTQVRVQTATVDVIQPTDVRQPTDHPVDRPTVARIEHFIRTHPWLARWIETLPCEVDPCVPPRLQHWFRTHPAAAHWIFWYIRTYVL